MVLKAVVDTLDGVDEKYHDLYSEKDGKFVMQPIEGMKPLGEFNTVYSALAKERIDHKATKTTLSAFGGMDAEDVRAKLDKLPELEIAASGKMDEDKIEKVVASRINTQLAPVARERDKLRADLVERENVIAGFQTEKRQRVISDTVTKAARTLKVLDTAQEDAVLLAERLFDLGEDGSVVTKDGVGVTPGITAAEWLVDMREKRPHWWGASAGGGAGAGKGGAGGPNPFTADGWNMTEQGQLMRTDRVKAERLAKQAGTTVGGQKPVKK